MALIVSNPLVILGYYVHHRDLSATRRAQPTLDQLKSVQGSDGLLGGQLQLFGP